LGEVSVEFITTSVSYCLSPISQHVDFDVICPTTSVDSAALPVWTVCLCAHDNTSTESNKSRHFSTQ